MRPEHVLNRLTSQGHKRREADRAAGFELAVLARRFSRRTQAVVDDKLSFSAVLMRAGEVEAANRLLAEVSEEVLTEEVALIERVNEVKVARSIERDKVTRGRLARTLAVAMLGSSLLAFSAAGAAVVGLFKENDQAIHGSDPDTARGVKVAVGGDRVMGTRQVRILNNVSLPMTEAEFRRYTKLTKGKIDEQELELFLLQLLPPSLAEQIHYALVTGLDALPEPVADKLVVAAKQMNDAHDDDATPPAEGNEPAADQADQADEPKDAEPTPEPSGAPSDEETPAPDESPEDDGGLPLIHDDDEGEG